MGAAWATAAIPIVGPAVAGVTVALALIFSRRRPGQKRATTQIVSDIEPHLAANLNGYLEGPRTSEARAQALANFDAGWQWVAENCCPGGGECGPMGPPGRWCIDDRKPGGKHDWFAYYRDPIARDAGMSLEPAPDGVHAAPDSIASAVPDLELGFGLDWRLVAGIGLVGLALIWKGG